MSASHSLAQSETFSKKQLTDEQSVIETHLDVASKELDRSVDRFGAKLYKPAQLSLLRADSRLGKSLLMLEQHPQKIVTLRASLLYSKKAEQEALRENYDKIWKRFNDLEDDLSALVNEMEKDSSSGSGNLAQQRALLKVVRSIVSRISDPALKKEVEALLDQASAAIDADDLGSFEAALAGLEAVIKQNKELTQLVEATDKSVLEDKPAPAAAADQIPSRTLADGSVVDTKVSRTTLADGSEKQETVETMNRPDGSKAVKKVVVIEHPDGSRDEVTVVEEYDANGNLISTTTRTKTYDANGTLIDEKTVVDNGEMVTVTDANNVTRTFRKVEGELKSTETIYTGGEGVDLKEEREIFLDALVDQESGAYNLDPRPGRERQWEFAIEQEEGSLNFLDDGSMQTVLIFRDLNLKSSFSIESWKVSGPNGEDIASAGAETSLPVTFVTSGQHTLQVSGKTDWGSPFLVRRTLNVSLE